MLLCVADVAGKGLPAALVMSNMQATLRALLGRARAAPGAGGAASELLYASTAPEKYVTAALAELEPSTGAITFVGAGHLDNVILRANGEAISDVVHRHAARAAAAGFRRHETARISWTGRPLVLFSDGVTDAQKNWTRSSAKNACSDALRLPQGCRRGR